MSCILNAIFEVEAKFKCAHFDFPSNEGFDNFDAVASHLHVSDTDDVGHGANESDLGGSGFVPGSIGPLPLPHSAFKLVDAQAAVTSLALVGTYNGFRHDLQVGHTNSGTIHRCVACRSTASKSRNGFR